MPDMIVNVELSEYAHMIMPDYKRNMQEALGLAPITPTGTLAGQYMKFNSKQAFLIPDAKRASGGETASVQFNGTLEDYILQANALKDAVDLEIEIPLAGTGGNLLKQAKVANLLSQGANAFSIGVFDAVLGATSAIANLGKWTDAAVDPLEELNSLLSKVEDNSGITPNVITMSKRAWRTCKSHPKVKGRFPGIATPITAALIAEELGDKDLIIETVGGRGFRSANTGKSGTSTVSFMGSSVIAHYRDPNPGPLSAGFASTLALDSNMIENVYEYTSLDGAVSYLRIKWAIKTVVKSTLLAARIDLA
jgi:hypothetical protein